MTERKRETEVMENFPTSTILLKLQISAAFHQWSITRQHRV